MGKNFVGKIFVRKKKLVEKTIFVRKKFIGKKFYWKIFLSESDGCDKHDLICILIYQMGRLCGGAHEISDIKAPPTHEQLQCQNISFYEHPPTHQIYPKCHSITAHILTHT